MSDEGALATATTLRFHRRVGRGLRRYHNWVQLAKFCLVGASGYVINLSVFAFAVKVLSIHHIAAATVAFLVAVTNNFWWNRHWTFKAHGGHAGFQAARFLTVSFAAFLVAVGILEALVESGTPKIAAQAVAIALATPIGFIGNKMWSFRLAR